MIKANVILNDARWKRKIKNPNNFLKKKLSQIKKIPFFKKKNQEFSILLTNKRSKLSNFYIEFDKMWIHGYFHLIGYDHKKLKDFKKMAKKEKIVLNFLHNKN